MIRERNIFYRVIKDEKSITELFCNLMQFDSFKELIINILRREMKIFKFSFGYNDICSEFNLGKLGRIDIAINSYETLFF
jgi:hypothetical protein